MSCTELSRAWAPGYSDFMTGTATDTHSILWKWPMDCLCYCFSSLIAFSAMETSQHRGWEGFFPLAGTGTAFLITSVSLNLYHAR